MIAAASSAFARLCKAKVWACIAACEVHNVLQSKGYSLMNYLMNSSKVVILEMHPLSLQCESKQTGRHTADMHGGSK